MHVDDRFRIAMAPNAQGGHDPVFLLPAMCNRHGLITGATGTGKTVTLKTIAQSLSDAGVPTFMADVKGDVAGMAVAGEPTDKLLSHLASIGIDDPDFHACPVRFWDIYGETGMPVRTTVSEMGPILLARLLGLSEVQAGVLNIAFHVADDMGLLLLDLKDLRAILVYLGEHADDFKLSYGNVTASSIGAIQRALLTLEDAGGDLFFGEPALDIFDWIDTDSDGKGYVNILDATRLVRSPLIYSTFLLWMLTELYESMPEVGDLDMPRMVFFFDEAHLLFNGAPRALVEKVEQVIKLIRSKGVGVFFITQNPADIPASVLAQLSNRVQHALRAYTPAELKTVRAAADSFRTNPAFDTYTAILELQTGEALISFLDGKGQPQVVQRAHVIAPGCSMDAAPAEDREWIACASPLLPKYASTIDRVSAYEMLMAAAGMDIAAYPVTQVTFEEIPSADAWNDDALEEDPGEALDAEPVPGELIDENADGMEAPEDAVEYEAPLELQLVQAELERLHAENEALRRQVENLLVIAGAKADKESQKAAKEAAKERERAEREAAREAERARKEAEKQAAKARKEAEREAERARKEAQKEAERIRKELERERARVEKEAEKAAAKAQRDAERRQRQIESIGVSVARTAATTLTRNIMGMLKKSF